MFESVNTPTHARTPARPVYYKLTCEPSAQVSLKCAGGGGGGYDAQGQLTPQSVVESV